MMRQLKMWLKNLFFENKLERRLLDGIQRDNEKPISLPKDELIGGWFKGADDGSGLNAIWGYGLEFKPDGVGIRYYWGFEEGDEINEESEFEWERTGETTIRLKYKMDSEWEEIEYVISDFIGAYEGKYKKIVKKGTSQFWSSPEPLYKSV